MINKPRREESFGETCFMINKPRREESFLCFCEQLSHLTARVCDVTHFIDMIIPLALYQNCQA